MKSILYAIGRAIVAVLNTIGALGDGVIALIQKLLGVPGFAAGAADEIADEALAQPQGDERKIGDRYDPDSMINRAIGCVASIGIGTPWPGMRGLPNGVQAWLIGMSKDEAIAVLRAPRAAQEEHLAGRKAIAGVQDVPKSGPFKYVIPEQVIEPGVAPRAFFNAPEHADARKAFGLAAAAVADRLRRDREAREARPQLRADVGDVDHPSLRMVH
jgi:hypothetical protein